jgi:hypothetical protein
MVAGKLTFRIIAFLQILHIHGNQVGVKLAFLDQHMYLEITQEPFSISMAIQPLTLGPGPCME